MNMKVKTKIVDHGPKGGGRMGRPPRELAAKVDERILDAGRRLFLERGLSGVSVEEIAREAHASKGTIYARFATKEELFAAIAMRNAANMREGFERGPPSGDTIEEQLIELGAGILRHLLTGDTIDFIRLAIAELRRFPDLAKVGRMMRERGAQSASAVFKEVSRSEQGKTFPGFASNRLAKTTQSFLDLVVAPLLMRAVFGEDVKALRAQIQGHVESSVSFFLIACRH
jgi:AcrR family transcriptional regulator